MDFPVFLVAREDEKDENWYGSQILVLQPYHKLRHCFSYPIKKRTLQVCLSGETWAAQAEVQSTCTWTNVSIDILMILRSRSVCYNKMAVTRNLHQTQQVFEVLYCRLPVAIG